MDYVHGLELLGTIEQIDNKYKFIDRMVHLIPLKCSFYTCPWTAMLSFPMTSLEEIRTMFNV
jgi:hypothetical protein